MKGVHINKTMNGAAVLVACLAIAGCGYGFKGGGLKAPQDVESVAVTVLGNRTSESGIETVFATDMAYEFTRSKVLRVVDSKTADAVLGGTIESMRIETVSHTADYASDERRVTITLDLALKRPNGDIIWSDSAVSEHEEFKVSGDRPATEKNKRAALQTMSKRLAEKVHNRILQGF